MLIGSKYWLRCIPGLGAQWKFFPEAKVAMDEISPPEYQVLHGEYEKQYFLNHSLLFGVYYLFRISVYPHIRILYGSPCSLHQSVFSTLAREGIAHNKRAVRA